MMRPLPSRRGRPRDFDINEVLERAMQLFWRNGYLGTSISDLTAAMGISRASLYAAFGNKETLYAKALDRYGSGPSAFASEALNCPTARAVVEQILTGVVESATGPRYPRGCMWVVGVLSSGDPDGSVKRDLIARRTIDETKLLKRFRRAVVEGDLPRDTNVKALTCYIGTINFGLAVQAAAGASRSELLRVVQAVLRTWPEILATKQIRPIR
jgi:AcrR family transcriptional regulator